MRFELSVALKYLLPRARQLSTSIISLVSILVISLVVWLVVVFLSVTHSIEKKWIEELVALNAPIRILPQEAYFDSYYYLIDHASEKSNYSGKTLGEKLNSLAADPYDKEFDAELPPTFPSPDLHPDGSLKDIVKEAWQVIEGQHVVAQEFETSFSNLQLDLVHERQGEKNVLNQLSYISSFDKENKRLKNLILAPSQEDTKNLLFALSLKAVEKADPSWWVYKEDADSLHIPTKTPLGAGILVSTSFQKHGVLLGDRGHLSYLTTGTSAVQEQRIPVYVAGFYNPGIMPVGSRMIFADHTLLESLRTPFGSPDGGATNGINIYFSDLKQTENLKTAIQEGFKKRGIDSYFTVESYADYEFARPVLDQLKSDKTLFTLIALIILIVACSNIISMLILLVNDKKKEIGILQSMGVSRKQIARIFGLCGCLTGILSSVIGIGAGLLTLANLNSLIRFLSFLQGREAFQSMFYGEGGLPNELSLSVLLFVGGATIIISLLAGIVPAVKASQIKPAAILRAE